MPTTILDLIGNTPLVEIQRLAPNPKVRILAKLEYLNPGGSIKDRAALAMIEAGEASGELTPEKIVIEATSGNTGIGLALVCSVKGYRLLLAMSELVSVERQKILKARGADILLTPGHLGTDGAIEEVYRLALESPDMYFMADQFNNPANWQAHYRGTAAEIWAQTEGAIDALVATMGTTGTLMGLSRRLKELRPDIRIIGVEPYLGHRLQGLKNMKEAYRPEIYEKDRLDEKVNVEDEESFEMTRQLARQEGLFVGMSSGAAMAVAAKVAKKMDHGTVVVIFPDGGERYLSTTLFAVRPTVGMTVFNTLSRNKEAFEPLTAGEVSVYTCGPTANQPIHLGHCRRFVFSDLLCRHLAYRGLRVRHVMNITDYDDKTFAGADSAGEPLAEYTARHIRNFHEDLQTLRVQPATEYPRASEHIDDMVALADKLVKKGLAYEKLRSLYFDISRFGSYGKLSGIDLEKIRVGATVDLDDYEKDNPRDFTLLKRATLSELKRGLFTTTPWGNVRPSWHLQCAAMSMTSLGETFDIHTSGRELMFPHHENEIAIAYGATGKPLARYWMHCDTVLTNGRAIDTKGSGISLRDVEAMGFSGREIRYWLLTTHYRKPVVFSNERLLLARKALERLDAVVHDLQQAPGVSGGVSPDLDQLDYDIKNRFTTAMDDDLNTSRAMASVFGHIKKINRLLQDGRLNREEAGQLLDTLARIDTVLGVFCFDDPSSDPEIQALINARTAARQARDWQRADEIRSRLEKRGIFIKDRKHEDTR
ncbi:MAG: cysteine--tRNA ligase [Pseudomonadota bacterium]